MPGWDIRKLYRIRRLPGGTIVLEMYRFSTNDWAVARIIRL